MYFFTPHDRHVEDAGLAAGYGKHVLVEKPIARSVAEAEGMVRSADEAGVKLMVAENYRFLPLVDRCKQLISQGAIGELRLVQVQSEAYGELTGWRTRSEVNGGGTFIDGGIHSVDILVNVRGTS